jgi:D-alanyl-D-alanine carboxypeptidase
MKTNKFIYYLLLILLLFSLNNCKKEIGPTEDITCSGQNINENHPKKNAINTIIADYVKKGLPGISVLIEDSNGIYANSVGFADIENNIAFKTCHISKAASITKMLVGTLTLKLQEEGKLSLNDPINKYIDSDIIKKINNAEGKTIRQLMNHSTGIFDVITSSKFYLAVLNTPNKKWTQEELLEFVYGEDGYELNAPFPAHYSNTNTLLLSMCIEKATGIPHHILLKEKILLPLGLENTYYQGRETLPTFTAQGYFDLHNNNSIVNVSNLITGSGNGYGGMFSNVFDLNKFAKALLINKTILSDSSLNEMQVFLQEDTDFYTGPGLIKKFTDKAAFGIGHTGRDLGYSADLFYFPAQNKTLVFFVNYGTNGSSALKDVFIQFESDIADALLE